MGTWTLLLFVSCAFSGHHAGRDGATQDCCTNGFCLLNNVVLGAMHARLRWGVRRVAVVDIDVHFGNGTAELLRDDDDAFFASVHMRTDDFYPAGIGADANTPRYVSVGLAPCDDDHQLKPRELSRGSQSFRAALTNKVFPALRTFAPELILISTGFDGLWSDPLGGTLRLCEDDFRWAAQQLVQVAHTSPAEGRLVSVLEGGYDVSPSTMGVARCTKAHIEGLLDCSQPSTDFDMAAATRPVSSTAPTAESKTKQPQSFCSVATDPELVAANTDTKAPA